MKIEQGQGYAFSLRSIGLDVFIKCVTLTRWTQALSITTMWTTKYTETWISLSFYKYLPFFIFSIKWKGINFPQPRLLWNDCNGKGRQRQSTITSTHVSATFSCESNLKKCFKEFSSLHTSNFSFFAFTCQERLTTKLEAYKVCALNAKAWHVRVWNYNNVHAIVTLISWWRHVITSPCCKWWCHHDIITWSH